MNESSQQRLDEFRAGYRNARPAAAGFVAWLQVLVILVGFAGIVALLLLRGNGMLGSGQGGLDPDAQRQLAAYLAQKKAWGPALDAYDRFLAHAAVPAQERAKVCFAAANVAIDAELYERALALLYQAEWLKPGAELQKEIDAKVMVCLEKLGRGAELRTALRERAQIGRDRDAVEAGDVVLAELGDRVFTSYDLDKALEKLPPAARDAMSTPEKKAELLKNIIAEYLLSEKARRQQLDQDPEIQAMLSDQLNALMVRKLLQEEVQSKIKVTDADIQRFYEREKARFTGPSKAVVRVGRRSAGTDQEFTFADNPLEVTAGQSNPELVGGDAAAAAILALEPGARTEAFAADGGAEVIYEVMSKAPGAVVPLSEVRAQIEKGLRQTKEREQLESLIQSLLKTHNVRIHEDRLTEEAS